MSVFIDTNVLLRVVDPGDAKHEAGVSALIALVNSGEVLVITPQVAAEFWNVQRGRFRTTVLACPSMKPATR